MFCVAYREINPISSYSGIGVVLWLRRLVDGLSPRRPGFDPRPCHVGFFVYKVSLRQVLYEYFRFLLSVSFRQMFSTHISLILYAVSVVK